MNNKNYNLSENTISEIKNKVLSMDFSKKESLQQFRDFLIEEGITKNNCKDKFPEISLITKFLYSQMRDNAIKSIQILNNEILTDLSPKEKFDILIDMGVNSFGEEYILSNNLLYLFDLPRTKLELQKPILIEVLDLSDSDNIKMSSHLIDQVSEYGAILYNTDNSRLPFAKLSKESIEKICCEIKEIAKSYDLMYEDLPIVKLLKLQGEDIFGSNIGVDKEELIKQLQKQKPKTLEILKNQTNLMFDNLSNKDGLSSLDLKKKEISELYSTLDREQKNEYLDFLLSKKNDNTNLDKFKIIVSLIFTEEISKDFSFNLSKNNDVTKNNLNKREVYIELNQ